MENIKTSVKGKVLTITVDLSKRLYDTEKSSMIATSRGNKPIDGTDAVIGLNIYIKKSK